MNDYKDLVIYAADIGSIKKNKFGWCRLESTSADTMTDRSIDCFVRHIIDDLFLGNNLCVGFECPLFLELPENSKNLTSARQGEGDRAWSAAAGSCSLTTGLTEVLWVFNEIANKAGNNVKPTFCFEDIKSGKANFFIWEAFVSATSKGVSHCDDAKKAVEEFYKRLRKESLTSDVHVIRPYSLAGAALVRSGLTKDVNFISRQCLVVKV